MVWRRPYLLFIVWSEMLLVELLPPAGPRQCWQAHSSVGCCLFLGLLILYYLNVVAVFFSNVSQQLCWSWMGSVCVCVFVCDCICVCWFGKAGDISFRNVLVVESQDQHFNGINQSSVTQVNRILWSFGCEGVIILKY